jgi:hypothetical protein
MNIKAAIIILMVSAFTIRSSAWIYPEHRDITLLAIQKLDPDRRLLLDKLWAQARTGNEYRLSEAVADVTLNEKPQYLDYAAWSAIGGDHSISPENMVYNILKTDWILKVADIAARLKNGIAAAKNKSEIEAELRNSDLRFLRADPEYISRAGANYGHFMLARPEVNISASDYFYSCYREGADLNLIGLYTNFHTSALLKASRLATEILTPEQSSELALAALADEAFALHFLEDGFSAGHVAGIWGNAALRKGTHDYYDEHGLDVITWNGDRLVLMGDAYMCPDDAEIASNIVLLSLQQLLDAAQGKNQPTVFNFREGVFMADTFNTSAAITMPELSSVPDYLDLYYEILINTPVPGLASGSGEIPRFRSEIGPFIGIAPSASVSEVSGGFVKSQTSHGAIPSLEFAVHFGLGTDGVLNKSGDGLVFLDLGWRLDGASNIKIKPEQEYSEFGSILSAIPSREALFARIRLPFYVIPGDLLIAGPVLLLLSPDTFNKMVVTASQGGLVPWQSGIITSVGRFQFMLGREVGVYFYGVVDGADAFLVPDERWETGDISLISLRSTKLNFPFLEYRLIRTFSSKQSASLLMQLYTEVDIPGKVTMKLPANVEPVELKPIWSLGIKLGFDWRYYYSNK